jgi:hypothetical protein
MRVTGSMQHLLPPLMLRWTSVSFAMFLKFMMIAFASGLGVFGLVLVCLGICMEFYDNDSLGCWS